MSRQGRRGPEKSGGRGPDLEKPKSVDQNAGSIAKTRGFCELAGGRQCVGAVNKRSRPEGDRHILRPRRAENEPVPALCPPCERLRPRQKLTLTRWPERLDRRMASMIAATR